MTTPNLMLKFQANLEKTALKLSKAAPLNEFPEGEVREALVYGYASNDLIENAIAVVINAAVSSKKVEFLLSRRVFIELFQNDPNIEPKNLNGPTMRKMVGSLVNCGLLERLTMASNKPNNQRKASLFRVVAPEVLGLIKGTPSVTILPVNQTR